ncbi:MAG: ACT domain-containing protein [Phycisphaerales bacterium]|nr:ACT domain-containing protein [Phycisphaerales bacterium]
MTRMPSLELDWLPGRFAICRLASADPIPTWATTSANERAALVAIVRTGAELTVVVPEHHVPPGVRAERGLTALAVRGPLDFALVGVLARLTAALAGGGVPVLAYSTFDTDVLLVRADREDDATRALARVAVVHPRPTTHP